MQKVYDTKSKQRLELENQEKTKTRVQEPKLPSSKKGSKHRTPLASGQRMLGRGVL